MNAFRHNRRLDPPGPKPFLMLLVALVFLGILLTVASELDRMGRRQPAAAPEPPVPAPTEPAPPAEPAEPPPQAVPGVWTEDYADALAAAKLAGLPVLLCFERSDWNPGSELLRRQVFESESWKAWTASNLFLVRVDFLRRPDRQDPKVRAVNEILARELKIEHFPSFVLLGADGRPIARPEIRRDKPPAYYLRQLAAARYEADPAALRTALGEARAAEYLALREAVSTYETRDNELRTALNADAERLRAAYEAAQGEAKAAAQDEMNRVLTERAQALRAHQKAGLEAARDSFRKLESYRDELAGLSAPAK